MAASGSEPSVEARAATAANFADSVGVALVLVEATSGLVTHLNTPAVDLLGFRSKDVVGKDIGRLFPRLAGAAWVRHASGAKGNVDHVVSSIAVRKSGVMVPVTIKTRVMAEVGGLVCMTVIDDAEGAAITEQMQRQIALSNAVSEVSRFLMTADGSSLDRVIEIMSGALSTHRGQIYRWNDELLTTDDGQSEWVVEGTSPMTWEDGPDDVSRLEWWFKKLNQGEAFQISDVNTLPSHASYLRDIYVKAGTRATVVAPIMSTKGKLIGVFGLVDLDLPRVWTPEDLAAMQTVAEMLAVFWERKEAEDAAKRGFMLESCVTKATVALQADGEHGIEGFLKVVTGTFGVDWSGITFYASDAQLVGKIHEYCAVDKPSFAEVARELAQDSSEWWNTRVQQFLPFTIGNVSWLPSAAAREKVILESAKAGSWASVALQGLDGGPRLGWLSLATHGRARQWRSEEVATIRVLAAMLATHWMRTRAERALARRLAIQQGLADVGRILLSPGPTDHARVAEVMAHAYGVGRGNIFFTNEAGQLDVATYSSPDGKDVRELLMRANSPTQETNWWRSKLNEGRAFAINDVTKLPPGTEVERRYFEQAGTKACLAAPILGRDGRRVGVVSFADLRGARDWEPGDVESVELLARLIGTHWQEMSHRKSLRQQAAVLSRIRDGLFSANMDGTILTWNPGAERIFGYSEVYAVGRSIFSLLDSPTVGEIEAELRRELSLNRRIEREYRIVDAKGQLKQVAFTLSLSETSPFQKNQVIVYATDVSERHELREQLQQAQRMEALGVLAGSVAHDFNNMLGPIVAYTQLVRGKFEPGSKDHERLGRVLAASGRAAELAKQILSFSRVREPDLRNVDLKAIVEEATGLIELAKPASIRLEVATAGSLPQIFADPTQIHQVIMNLCTNAWQAIARASPLEAEITRKYTDKIKRTGTALRHATDEEGGRLTVGGAGSGTSGADELGGKELAGQEGANEGEASGGSRAPASSSDWMQIPNLDAISATSNVGDQSAQPDFTFGEYVASEVELHERDQAKRAGGGTVRIELESYESTEQVKTHVVGLSQGRCIRLTVVDDGRGIPAEVLPRIFEPFFSTKRATSGTGLGLAAVHGILRTHGAVCSVSSKVGAGTRFDVYFPVNPAVGAAAGEME